MNKQSKSLGKRSTNTASLSNAISSIKSSISPVIRTGVVSSHPKPLKANNEMWLPRTVRFFQTCDGNNDFTTSPSLANIFNNAGVTGQIRVLGVKVWNYTNNTQSTNYIQCDTVAGLTETAVTTSVNDIGNAAHLPGVMVKIPRTIASNLVTSSTAGTFIVVTAVPSGQTTTSLAGAQQIVIDVHFEYKTDTAN